MSSPPPPPRTAAQALPAEVVQRLASAGHERRVPSRTILFRQGDHADGMYVVEEGEVEIHFNEGRPAKKLGPGAILGEIALLTSKGTRTASAVAATDCRITVVDRERFAELLASEPALICQALQYACTYLIESEEHLIADLRQRNRELEQALDFLRRTREELDATEVRAQTDELTGLYNRRCLNEQLARFLDRARAGASGLAVLLMDLDKFKPVNDTFGHAAGDVVLKRVAAVIRETVRSTDLPCRIGGDEFAVLLFPIEPDVACDIALRLRRAVATQEIHAPEGVLRVGATIGGTIFRPDDDAASLLDRADKSLYMAKDSGRNRVGWEGRVIEGERA